VTAGTEVFFREWRARRPGQTRSLDRARLLATALGLLDPGVPVLTVVGSKGKGTAATYASAHLAAAGLRVCTVTSPGLRSNRERIRVCGQALTGAELLGPSGRLGRAMDTLPAPDAGYLSPSGLFTLAGLLHARTAGADVIVLEAGMGGRSDEAGLFPPAVVAITPIFAEHVGVLGDTPAAIAAEKAGVADATTRAVVSAPQSPEVTEALARTLQGHGITLETLDDHHLPAPAHRLPEGFGRINALAGSLAARRLLEVCGRPAPDPGRLASVLSSVTLPGRLSWHPVPGTGSELLADCAISRPGVATALATARDRWGAIDHVFVCLPDHKDVSGAIAELGGLPVTFVRLPDRHLRFTHPLPPDWRVLQAEDLTRGTLTAAGRRVVTLGTVYFVGRVLDLLDADTERLFTTASTN
jgi:dihydrofolate synthase/folylpolyglutamate synthase